MPSIQARMVSGLFKLWQITLRIIICRVVDDLILLRGDTYVIIPLDKNADSAFLFTWITRRFYGNPQRYIFEYGDLFKSVTSVDALNSIISVAFEALVSNSVIL